MKTITHQNDIELRMQFFAGKVKIFSRGITMVEQVLSLNYIKILGGIMGRRKQKLLQKNKKDKATLFQMEQFNLFPRPIQFNIADIAAW